MKIFIAIAMLALLLSGCGLSPQQVKHDVEQQVAHDIAVKVQPVATADLLNQEQIAAANGDVEGANCASVTIELINKYAAPIPKTTAGGACPRPEEFIDPVTKQCKLGVASLIEAGRISAAAPPPPPFRLPPEWLKGCAVVAHDLRLSAADLLAKFGIAVGSAGAVLP